MVPSSSASVSRLRPGGVSHMSRMIMGAVPSPAGALHHLYEIFSSAIQRILKTKDQKNFKKHTFQIVFLQKTEKLNTIFAISPTLTIIYLNCIVSL